MCPIISHHIPSAPIFFTEDYTGWQERGNSESATVMSMFVGTFKNRIDRKGRVSLPADFRAELPVDGNRAVYVYPLSRHPVLEAGGRAFMERVSRAIEQPGMLSEEELGFSIDAVSEARKILIDGEGRIILPEMFVQLTGIADQAAFVGCGERFQIWSPETYDNHRAAAIAQMPAPKPGIRPVGPKLFPRETPS